MYPNSNFKGNTPKENDKNIIPISRSRAPRLQLPTFYFPFFIQKSCQIFNIWVE